jgi:putative phosphoserine phosphatase / 1-acylglycerol-3-phosphate O-acyltransferase
MRKAAIFDLDGTLIPNASAERVLFTHLLQNGTLGPFSIVRILWGLIRAHGNLHRLFLERKVYLRGKPVEKISEVTGKYFEGHARRMVFPAMLDVIEEHRQKGELLLLLSGTLDLIADCFVRDLHMDGSRATNLQVRDGHYTGHVVGVVPYGIGKLEVLREFRHRYKFDQNSATLYANLYSDRYVMNAVDMPVAVNPDRRLEQYARLNGWRILDVGPHSTSETLEPSEVST